MTITLNESIIQAGSTNESFKRGKAYYQDGSIERPTISDNEISAICSGNSAPFYKVRVFFDELGIKSATCTCEYDYGGYCKHIVALMLTYVHKRQSFVNQPSLNMLLADVGPDQMRALLLTLVERHDLRDALTRLLLQANSANPQSSTSATGQTQTSRRVDVKPYQQRIKLAFSSFYKQRERYDYDSDFEDDEDLAEEFESILNAIQVFLDANEIENVVAITVAVAETVSGELQQNEDEYDLSSAKRFQKELDLLLAEALLLLDWPFEKRQAVVAQMHYWDSLPISSCVLDDGWESDDTTRADSSNYNQSPDLVEVKLNVLKRQEKVDEFLALARLHQRSERYVNQLIALNRDQEAINYAKTNFKTVDEAFALAKLLRERQLLEPALNLAEIGLDLEGRKTELCQWLGPIEETQGRNAQAVKVWMILFSETPSLALYQRIQNLDKSGWAVRKAQLLVTIKRSWHVREYAEILLYEQAWDAAIALANKQAVNDEVAGLIADTLIAYHPTWVAEFGRKKAENYINLTSSSKYPIAVVWLERVKKAYAKLDQKHTWDVYFSNLKEMYKRRPSLQKELKSLS